MIDERGVVEKVSRAAVSIDFNGAMSVRCQMRFALEICGESVS